MRYILSCILGTTLALGALTVGAQTSSERPPAAEEPAATATTTDEPASASSLGSSDIDLAKKHFENGLALMEVEDFVSAAVEFEASVAAYPSKNALFNLGMCYKATHHYEQSLAAFRRLIADFADNLDPESRVDAEQNIASLGRLIAELEVRTSVPGAQILIDGAEVGVTPLSAPLVVKVGEHRVRAVLEGHKTQERLITVLGGDHKVTFFELEQTEPGAAAAVAPLVAPAATETQPTEELQSAPASQIEHRAPKPPKEISHIFQVYGAGVGMQALAGAGVLIAVPIVWIKMNTFAKFYQNGFPAVFGIAHAFASIIGGTVTWSVGNKSKHYDVSYWAPLVGGIGGNGLSFGLGMIVWSQTKDEVDTGTEAGDFISANLLPIVFGYFVGPLLLPPVFEALMYGLVRRPEDRYGLAMQWIPPSVGPMISMSGHREMMLGINLIGARF